MSGSVATVTTIKAPVQQTLAFVGYHLCCGIDHMFLYFDDPQDASIPYLTRKNRVTCIPCDEPHWRIRGITPEAAIEVKQETNATEAFRLARQAGFEWLVHVDSDELLYAERSLPDLFSCVPPQTEVLVFPTCEAVPQRLQYDRPFRDISLFKYNPAAHFLQGNVFKGYVDRRMRGPIARIWRYKRRLVKWLGCDHPTFMNSFLLGHTNGKAATRTSSPVREIGIHRPQEVRGQALCIYTVRRGAVLHFDCMGYEQWRDKWTSRLNGSAHFDTSRFRSDRLRLLRMFESALQTGSDAVLRDLYRRMYVLSPRQKAVLRSLGFVRRIRLDEEHFAAS